MINHINDIMLTGVTRASDYFIENSSKLRCDSIQICSTVVVPTILVRVCVIYSNAVALIPTLGQTVLTASCYKWILTIGCMLINVGPPCAVHIGLGWLCIK